MKRLLFSALLLFVSVWVASGGSARKVSNEQRFDRYQIHSDNLGGDRALDADALFAEAVAETFVLAEYTFDTPAGGADPQGWTGVDLTTPEGTFFHVDDFAGLDGGDYGGLVPLEGNQSLWCGARADSADEHLCRYATLPGYGGGWDQSWCFKCIEVPDTETVYISYLASWDTEPGYDYWYIEYATNSSCDSLQNVVDIPEGDWIKIVTMDDFVIDQFRRDSIPSGHDGFLRIRFRFQEDGAWNDQDGRWNTDGAVVIDSLTVETDLAVYDFEDFEDEAVGDLGTMDGDWEAWTMPGFGDFAGLFSGITLLQEDPCRTNLSFMWAFINGSTDTYACGGHPEQIAVPLENEHNQYINNQIVSPLIPVAGAGAIFELAFDVYRDLTGIMGGYVWYNWAVRSWTSSCPGYWKNYDPVGYYGAGKDWYRAVLPMQNLIEAGATHIQVALEVQDWAEIFVGYPDPCHSHSPLFDNVEVRRILATGPLWSSNDTRLFQDTFPSNGTGVGTGRIDVAGSPGDSARVICRDYESGLLEPEPYTGFGSAVYCYAAVYPQNQPGKSGSALEADNFRWPVVDSVTIAGSKWYIVRMDTAYSDESRIGRLVDGWVVDLNDNLLESGDTLCFFFGAENATGGKSYYSRNTGVTGDREEAAANPMEMQVLPCGALSGRTDVLYVDNYDGRGAQPYFDSAFEMMGITPDRYDVRSSRASLGNTLAGRVVDVAQQLIPYYRKIIWNTGDLYPDYYVLIGDGDDGEADDFALFTTFLSQHTDTAGIYISGDDVAEEWNSSSSASAIAFRNTYMNHNLVSGSHRGPVDYGVSPLVIGEGGSMFDHPGTGVDTAIAFGGCPVLNDFDVLGPAGSATLQMTYNSPGNPQAGAVLAQAGTNTNGNPIGVVLSGFSFHYLYDDATADIPDRVDHLTDILRWLGNELADPTVVEAPPVSSDYLSQNYPNPFNPVTTIAYSIRYRGHVTMKIYDIAGRLVKTLVNGMKVPRAEGYTVTWDGSNNSGEAVASGVYFCRLVAKDFTETRKMVLLK